MAALVRIVSNRAACDPTAEEVLRAYENKYRDSADEMAEMESEESESEEDDADDADEL